jgi:hypothetical protein
MTSIPYHQDMQAYWRVKLTEKVGGQIIEGWVRSIPALTAAEAKAKAVAFIKRRTPGANPKPVMAQRELQISVNPVIEIRGVDDKGGLILP